MKCGKCGNKDSHKLSHVGSSTLTTVFPGPLDEKKIMTVWFMCLVCNAVNCAKPNFFGIHKHHAFYSAEDFLDQYSDYHSFEFFQPNQLFEFKQFFDIVRELKDSNDSTNVTRVVCPSCRTANNVPSSRLGDNPACGKCKNDLFP